jgi:hypothetical protein
MTSPTLKNIEKTIRSLKQRLARTGDMRPGTLSVQYRNPKEQQTSFHQISYTHQGKSRSQYVRPENLTAIRQEIDAYRRFKSTVQELVALSIEASRLRHRTTRKT